MRATVKKGNLFRRVTYEKFLQEMESRVLATLDDGMHQEGSDIVIREVFSQLKEEALRQDNVCKVYFYVITDDGIRHVALNFSEERLKVLARKTCREGQSFENRLKEIIEQLECRGYPVKFLAYYDTGRCGYIASEINFL